MEVIVLAAVGWAASPFIKTVMDKVKSDLEENYDLYGGMVDRLNALEGALTRIDGAINAVEARLIKEPDLVAWQRQLKDAAYRAQDVFDDLESKFLIHKMKSGKKVLGVFSFAKLMVLSDNDLNNLKNLVKHIENIDRRLSELYGYMEQNPASSNNNHFLSPQEMIGRNKETNVIISMLSSYTKEAGTSTTPSFVVVPIVGIGGVGKTTFARHTFDIEKLLSDVKSQEKHFPLSAWLDVHDSLNAKNVKNIASTLVSILSKNEETSKIEGDNRFTDESLECNLQKLKNMTKDKRFLIVLDDVQDVDEDCWAQLKTALACGTRGSSVLVTTQYQRVAKTMKTVEPVQLDLLNKGDYQKLLEQCAFSESILEEQLKHDLQSIATKISETLQGLPLAGKALGKLLSKKMDIAEWNSILKSKWWERETVLGCVLPSLGLNYQNLKANQKRCFAYCSIFPKEYSFVEDRLVHMWMAQGFIHHNIRGEMSIEEIGRQIFTELVDRNFFRKISDNEYIMPDVIRELAVYLSLDDSFVINDETEIEKIPSPVYHLTIDSNKLDVFTGKNRYRISFKKLRTILFFGKYETKKFYKVLRDILSRSESLRVLDLSHTGTEISKLPRAIGDLSHLRYLDISNTKISMLPKLFCKLCHLQVLNLQHCHLNGLPEGMNKLISLRHLCAESKTVSLISGIGKLTCLQELKEFHVRKEEGHKIEELKNLKNLRGQLLIQNVENVNSKEEAMNAKLKEKKHLDALQLYFEIRDGMGTESTIGELLEGLEPRCDLKELGIIVTIKVCHGDIFPSWLVNRERFACLTSIHLCSCDFLTILPPLGQLPLLRALHIETMPALRKIGVELYGEDDVVFPSLKDLTLIDLGDCEEWSEVEGRQLFPCLRRLHIEQCMELTKLAILRLNLPVAELKIKSCGDLGSSLTECLQRFTLLTLLEISNYQHMTSLSLCNLAALEDLCLSDCPKLSFQEDLRALTNLKKLKIAGCPMLCNFLQPQQPQKMRGLQSLNYLLMDHDLLVNNPGILLGSLSALQILDIFNYSLDCFSEEQEMWLQQLTSLQELKFSNCDNLKLLPANLATLTVLKKLTVHNCPEITSLPMNVLPALLKELHFSGCPRLKQQCQKATGPEWPNIAHVPLICIDQEIIQMSATSISS